MALHNTLLNVQFDPKTQTVTCRSESQEPPFAQGRITESGATVEETEIAHESFGTGRALQIAEPGGDSHSIALFPDLPFVLCRSTLVNDRAEPRRVHHLRTLAFALTLPQPPEALRALGTAGLTAPEGHGGSYAFLAIADPKTRAGVVSGWLTHERGSGVIFSTVEDRRVHLRPQIDYGSLIIPPGASEDTEWFALGRFDDARLGLEAYADAIARHYGIDLPPQPSGYCTWYADKHGGASDAQHLDEITVFAEDHLQPFGLAFIQIDDKWQKGQRRNGPAKNFTAHNPEGPYPDGMKPTAEALAARGFTPGLWFMPFAADHEDPYFVPHPEWIVHRKNGDPYETRWGGTSLDMTHPGAQAHLAEITERITREWGYRYIKIDGLWTGSATEIRYIHTTYADDGIGEAVFHDPAKTNLEAYRDGLRKIRQTAGEGVYILGCNVSQNLRTLGGSFGLVDAMRIGPDNGAKWEALMRGPQHGTRHYFFHRRVWHNDPDPVYVRETMPLHHARLIASWIGISGQLCVNSDWLPDLPDERLDILKRIMPAHALQARPVDLFQNDPARIWLLTDDRCSPPRHVLAFYNWDDAPADFDMPLSDFGLPDDGPYAAFDFWDGAFLPAVETRMALTVPPQACRIVALRRQTDYPLIVSTSRHITQGMRDVAGETWDGTTLCGASALVANDPYELRIATHRHVHRADVSDPDRKAGVHIADIRQKDNALYIRIHSPESRTVHWHIRFA